MAIVKWVGGASLALVVMGAAGGVASAAMQRELSGDAVNGKSLYQACAACHSIDDNDLGPRHRGVVGRRAGSVGDYAYSVALKSSGLTWDDDTLNRWLINPTALVPGTKMFFQLPDAQSRADIIAYLKTLQ